MYTITILQKKIPLTSELKALPLFALCLFLKNMLAIQTKHRRRHKSAKNKTVEQKTAHKNK